MKKLFLTFLLINISVNADIDIGDDFAPGDLVSAEAFNFKFGKLKQVVGEIKDSDILGTWNCTAYEAAPEPQDADSSFLTENGGNGQVGNGYFYSNSGTLTFSENDTESSLISPKQWSASKGDLIEDSGNESGTYTLLINKLHFFYQPFDDIRYGAKYDINFLDSNNMGLSLVEKFNDFYPVPNILCQKSS